MLCQIETSSNYLCRWSQKVKELFWKTKWNHISRNDALHQNILQKPFYKIETLLNPT